MKALLLILVFTVPAVAQIEQLLKEGASVDLRDRSLVFVPVKFEPCNLVWQIKHQSFSREVTIDLSDLDAKRFRIEAVKDQKPIVQLMLYTLNDRELIREQTIYPDKSRTDVNHKSRHVLFLKHRPTAEKLSEALMAASTRCIDQNTVK